MDQMLRKAQQVGHSQKPTGQRAVETKESNITNFYQQKKRIIASDSDSPLLKKSRRSNDSELTAHADQPIITWESPRNTSVDCQLKLSESIGAQNSQQDSMQIARRNECKMDQMLNEFHAKLQFEGLSKEEDSGNSESDGVSDDESWLTNKDLKEPNEHQIAAKPTSSASTNSRESGIGSCDSSELDLNRPEAGKPEPNRPEPDQSPSAKPNLFKVPETPNKPNGHSKKPPIASNSIQFFSTPKAVIRQRSMNQTLNFVNLSPIKSDCTDNSLINLQSDNKRALSDSRGEEAPSKRRNGKVLFKPADENRQANQPCRTPVALASIGLTSVALTGASRKEEDLFDDSFDQILSQMDDKAILQPKAVPAANQFDDFDDDDSFDHLLSQVDNQTLMKTPANKVPASQFNFHANGQLYRQTNENRAGNRMGNQMGNQISRPNPLGSQSVNRANFQSQQARFAANPTGRPISRANCR